MNDEIYSAPNAELADAVGDDDAKRQEFYLVSTKKFTLLFFGTLGLYTIYWFYRNWKLQKQKHQLKIWPVPRSIFNIFFTHSLFENISLALEQRERTFSWSPSALATVYVILQILSNILDRLSWNEIGSPTTDLAGIAILPFIYYPLVRAQTAVNIALDDPKGLSNAKLSAVNIIWLILGTIMWLLILVGLGITFGFVPE